MYKATDILALPVVDMKQGAEHGVASKVLFNHQKNHLVLIVGEKHLGQMKAVFMEEVKGIGENYLLIKEKSSLKGILSASEEIRSELGESYELLDVKVIDKSGNDLGKVVDLLVDEEMKLGRLVLDSEEEIAREEILSICHGLVFKGEPVNESLCSEDEDDMMEDKDSEMMEEPEAIEKGEEPETIEEVEEPEAIEEGEEPEAIEEVEEPEAIEEGEEPEAIEEGEEPEAIEEGEEPEAIEEGEEPEATEEVEEPEAIEEGEEPEADEDLDIVVSEEEVELPNGLMVTKDVISEDGLFKIEKGSIVTEEVLEEAFEHDALEMLALCSE